MSRRTLVALGGLVLLAGCQVVPKPGPGGGRPVPRPTDELPADQQRHRIALLVHLSGEDAALTTAYRNATPATAVRAAPPLSIDRTGEGSSLGSHRMVMTNASASIGATDQKAACQPNVTSAAPPSSGPSSAPIAWVPPMIPTAVR